MIQQLLSKRYERPFITDTNLSPVVEIVCWLLLSFMILSTGTRFLTKLIVASKLLGVDDFFASTALVFAVGQTICVLLSTRYGLGKAFEELSERQYDIALKAQFAGDLLFLLSLWSAKISTICFLNMITLATSHRHMLRCSALLLTIWMLTGIVANSFQCHLPHTWDYINNHCFDRLAFYRYIGISNILTEAMIMVLPALIVLSLHTSISRKMTILIPFCARILVVGATIGQLIELNAWFAHSDVTLSVWPYQICTQCVQALCVITSCVPYLKPFLESLKAGALRTDNAIMHRYGSSWTRSRTTESRSLIDGHIRATGR